MFWVYKFFLWSLLSKSVTKDNNSWCCSYSAKKSRLNWNWSEQLLFKTLFIPENTRLFYFFYEPHNCVNVDHKQCCSNYVRNNFVKFSARPFLVFLHCSKQERSTPETNSTWENGSWRFAFFTPNSVKWTKRIFIEKSDIFSSQGRSNMLCEMRVAWVWLFQKASACHCLPSQLLQTPAPWLPYMRDQGLPRCFWKRRAHCE